MTGCGTIFLIFEDLNNAEKQKYQNLLLPPESDISISRKLDI
jgi:hypothetical protein